MSFPSRQLALKQAELLAQQERRDYVVFSYNKLWWAMAVIAFANSAAEEAEHTETVKYVRADPYGRSAAPGAGATSPATIVGTPGRCFDCHASVPFLLDGQYCLHCAQRAQEDRGREIIALQAKLDGLRAQVNDLAREIFIVTKGVTHVPPAGRTSATAPKASPAAAKPKQVKIGLDASDLAAIFAEDIL